MPIVLREAISILENGQWCSLRYITANTTRGGGGKVIELAKCRIARQRPAREHTGDKPAVYNSSSLADEAGEVKKDPNHRYHFTRNIELQNKNIRTLYPILITHINQQAVL